MPTSAEYFVRLHERADIASLGEPGEDLQHPLDNGDRDEQRDDGLSEC
jgi:hypothetical protein